MLHFLVNYERNNVLISIDKKEDFIGKCRSVFAIPQGAPLKVEIFFEEFNEYAEITDVVNDLPEKAKLRLTRRDDSVLFQHGLGEVLFIGDGCSTR